MYVGVCKIFFLRANRPHTSASFASHSKGIRTFPSIVSIRIGVVVNLLQYNSVSALEGALSASAFAEIGLFGSLFNTRGQPIAWRVCQEHNISKVANDDVVFLANKPPLIELNKDEAIKMTWISFCLKNVWLVPHVLPGSRRFWIFA